MRFSYFRQRKQQEQEQISPESELDLLESSHMKGSRVLQNEAVSNNQKTTDLSLEEVKRPINNVASNTPRGGNGAAPYAVTRPLLFWESMVCGAVSRSIAQTLLHPANAMKVGNRMMKGGVLHIVKLRLQYFCISHHIYFLLCFSYNWLPFHVTSTGTDDSAKQQY